MLSELDAFTRGAAAEEARAKFLDQWGEKEQTLLDSCHPYQRAFVEDQSKRVAALTGGRCGKTTGGRARLLRRMMRQKRARCLFIAETRSHAETLIWGPLKDVVERLGIPAKFNETKLLLTFLENGSQLQIAGADDKREVDKLRGIPRHEVGIDEGASYPPALLDNLVDRVITPRLGDYDGTLWIIGTPGHRLQGTFYDVTRPGSNLSRRYDQRHEEKYADWFGWSLHGWSMREAADHVPAIALAWKNALLEKERKGWSDDNPIWMREYLGLWAADDTENVFRYRPHTDDGAEWNQWDPPKDKRTGFAVLPTGDWVYVYGHDMGHSDPFATVILAHNPITNELRHVYEFEEKGLHVRDIAKHLIGSEWVDKALRGEDQGQPGSLIGVTGWPTSIVADSLGMGGAIIDELREVYGLPVEKAEQKNKHDAIELVNSDLIDGRLKILKGSKLETQMMNLQWAVDDIGRLKESKGQPNHLTDALIYGRKAATHLTGSPIPVEPDTSEAPPAPNPRRHAQRDDDEFSFDLAEIDFGNDFDDDF